GIARTSARQSVWMTATLFPLTAPCSAPAHSPPSFPTRRSSDLAVRHHGLVHEYDHPEVGRLRLMGQPLVFAETPTRDPGPPPTLDRKSTRLNSSHDQISYAVFCLKKKTIPTLVPESINTPIRFC